MIFFIATLLTRTFGIDLQKAQRLIVWILLAVGLIFVIALAVSMYSCLKPTPKFRPEETIKAQQAIAKEDRKEMIEILADSTVREQGIDNSIKLAEEATEKAKRDLSQQSNEELAAELERLLKEQQ